MNILMVTPNVAVGGAQKIMLYLAHGLERRGHRVVILTTHIDFARLPEFTRQLTYVVSHQQILRPGGYISNYQPISNPALLAMRLGGLRAEMKRLVRSYDIDIVNPHNPPANWIASFLQVPTVWSCHNNPISFYANVRHGYTPLVPDKRAPHHRAAELAYEALDFTLVKYGIRRTVALSDRIARQLARVYRIESDVITFVPSSEDGIRHTAAAGDGKFAGMNGKPMVLVQVGQLNEFKRPMFSLDVFETVRRRIPQVRLLFVGDGDLRSGLAHEIDRRGLRSQVSLVGMCDESQLGEIYARAHVLLFPGADQPLGLVPIEAVCNSVVPIVADSSGVASIMARLGAITVAGPTVEAFAERVISVYERRSEMDEWLLTARQVLAREFSFDVFLDKYERCFRRCLKTV